MHAVVNFWSCTYNVTVSSEAELKSRAEALAKERRTRVCYYAVVDGKSKLLGVAGVSSSAPAPVARAGTSEQLGLAD